MTCCIPTSSLLTHTPTCWGSQTSTSRSRGEPKLAMLPGVTVHLRARVRLHASWLPFTRRLLSASSSPPHPLTQSSCHPPPDPSRTFSGHMPDPTPVFRTRAGHKRDTNRTPFRTCLPSTTAVATISYNRRSMQSFRAQSQPSAPPKPQFSTTTARANLIAFPPFRAPSTHPPSCLFPSSLRRFVAFLRAFVPSCLRAWATPRRDFPRPTL